MRDPEQIALELTKAAIDNGIIKHMDDSKDQSANVNSAKAVAEAFDIIYKSVDKTLAGE